MPARRAQASSPPGRKGKQSPSKSLNVLSVVFDDYQMTPWYPSYYPEEVLGTAKVDKLYVCTSCFRYTQDVNAYVGHMSLCEYAQEPPGEMIYSDNNFYIYKIDGEEHQLFAQNLSLFAKLFIENKSVCYDVGGFDYFLMLQANKDLTAIQKVGFFSREKLSWDNNNLACILVFPPHQHQGHGQRLMAASYALSRRDDRLGGPERPLSVPGKKSYTAYWAREVARCILEWESDQTVTLKDICDETYILPEDITSVILQMGILGGHRGDGLMLSKTAVQAWVDRSKVDVAEPILDSQGWLPGFRASVSPSVQSNGVEYISNTDDSGASDTS